jgi:predicted RNA binding protein YcfA (HicA-like mRNA interferase family)
MPRKVRQILKDYKKSGFYVVSGAGKGDHRKLKHENFPGAIILDGKEGADCKPYQERDLQNALTKIKQA